AEVVAELVGRDGGAEVRDVGVPAVMSPRPDGAEAVRAAAGGVGLVGELEDDVLARGALGEPGDLARRLAPQLPRLGAGVRRRVGLDRPDDVQRDLSRVLGRPVPDRPDHAADLTRLAGYTESA